MNNRRFTLWYYTVSHGQALLRSVGRNGTQNIDIYFGSVEYIDIPTDIDGLELCEPTPQDKQYINKRIGAIRPNQKITVLLHKSVKYYIVSSVVKVLTNNLQFYELPFDIPNDMGGVFYRPEMKNQNL